MKLPHVAYKILWALNMCPRVDGEWVNISGSHKLIQYIRGGLHGNGFYEFYANKDDKPMNVFKIKSYSDAVLVPCPPDIIVKTKKRNWLGIFK